MLNGLGGLIAIIGPILEKVLERIPDAKTRAEAAREARRLLAESEARIFEAARDVLVAETSGSRLQRLWRPLAMLNFLLIIDYIVIVAPWFGTLPATLEALSRVPAELWTLITVGMGGYILGRSGEKMMERWPRRES